MYFLSATDPNYRIKGSRDPLGFQSLWAAAGHKAVKHLSTVSSNLKDFMILCYGIYFHGNHDPKEFIRFFILLEQMFAYARMIGNHEISFNGVDYIHKRTADDKFYISLKDTILNNQRAYGIYGKYIRPLRDIGITEDPEFSRIMEGVLSKTDKIPVLTWVKRFHEDAQKRYTVARSELKPFALLLNSLTNDERQLYRKYFLKVPGELHPQNDLYEVIRNNHDIIYTTFQLHPIIQFILSNKEISDTLRDALINIDNTDKVLHPLNKVFTHMLSKSYWITDEVIQEPVFTNLPGKVSYYFHDETLRSLNELLELPVLELVKQIIKRNEEVSKIRGNKAWIEEDKKSFRILYGEKGQKITSINNDTDYEFPYFLNNYINLFRQIEME